jgi:hypothetical protein
MNINHMTNYQLRQRVKKLETSLYHAGIKCALIALVAFALGFVSCFVKTAEASVLDNVCFSPNKAGGNIVLLLDGSMKGYSNSSSGSYAALTWVFIESTEQVIITFNDGSMSVFQATSFTCTGLENKPKKNGL